jgi:hypothetical protein
VPEYTAVECLAVMAVLAGAYVIATGDEGPITRRAWALLNPGQPEPPEIPHEEILAQRAMAISAIEGHEGRRALVPEIVSIVDTQGCVHHLPVDDLTEPQVLAAEVAEAACMAMLARALNTRAARIAGLERLRRMRADLEHVEGAI